MRALLLAVVLAVGCDDAGLPTDAAAPVEDMAVGNLSEPDSSVPDMRPCGQPEQQCCVTDAGETCDPSMAVCNPFGVCVACGVYPLNCCPGATCRAMQTCLDDSTIGAYCYPCGHVGQSCCFLGDPCLDAGTCDDFDGGSTPVCVP